jgi:hypothetical protein
MVLKTQETNLFQCDELLCPGSGSIDRTKFGSSIQETTFFNQFILRKAVGSCLPTLEAGFDSISHFLYVRLSISEILDHAKDATFFLGILTAVIEQFKKRLFSAAKNKLGALVLAIVFLASL